MRGSFTSALNLKGRSSAHAAVSLLNKEFKYTTPNGVTDIPPPINIAHIQQLRHRIRNQRMALSRQFWGTYSNTMCYSLKQQPSFIKSQHIAYYWPINNEIDLRSLITYSQHHNKKCYLPKMGFNRRLVFIRYRRHTRMTVNRWNIREPATGRCISARKLDIAFVPLIAFAIDGNRLGYGAGYYDKNFAFKARKVFKKPSLIGVAYPFQQATIPIAHKRDIRMDAIVVRKDPYQ